MSDLSCKVMNPGWDVELILNWSIMANTNDNPELGSFKRTDFVELNVSSPEY